jgi:4-hydroxysphinganine ceramide fatty acyl 2-hydroxylase
MSALVSGRPGDAPRYGSAPAARGRLSGVTSRSPNYKSERGLPPPRFPAGIEWKVEARKARRRLYPVTFLYVAFAGLVLWRALLRERAWVSFAWFGAGIFAWTWIEYLVHRFILHGRFPAGTPLQNVWHRAFDHLHYEHHARPWDGNHINGTIKDTLPFVAPLAALSFLAPIHTAPTLLGGILVSYIAEEWVHQSVHFYDFRSTYWRYIKRHHWFHHSPVGTESGYGLTNGFWDVIYRTRIPWSRYRRRSRVRSATATS